MTVTDHSLKKEKKKMSSGTAGETMFVRILQSMGFEDKSQSIGKERLLNTARKIRPGRIENVVQKRREAGKPTNWKITSARLVLDWVYGLDCVIDVDGNGRLFAIDFTVNASKVRKKTEKLKKFSRLWRAVGIEKAAVVLAIPPTGDFGLALLSQNEQEKIKDDLYEVIFSMDESSLDVSKYIVSW